MQPPLMVNLIHTLWPSKANGESSSSDLGSNAKQSTLKRKFDDM